MTRIAINWFGRIGKLALKSIIERGISDIEVVAVNDLWWAKTAAHLFEFDSTYWKFNWTVEHDDENIIVNGKKIRVCSERNPEDLPWKEFNIDVVLECTGVFRNKEWAMKHITAWAKKVIISAPAKGEVDWTYVVWVNDEDIKNTDIIVSNASCTTNCLAPVVKVLNDNFKIIWGLMNTIHSYTGDQRVLDAAHSDLRRWRTATESIIPTSTGAAKAVWLVIPELKWKLDWFSMRVPTPTVSCVDFTFETKEEIDIEKINNSLKQSSENELKWILWFETRPLVSIDYRKDDRSSIIDADLTKVIWKHMWKIVAWYDNEWGYSCRLVDLAKLIGNL